MQQKDLLAIVTAIIYDGDARSSFEKAKEIISLTDSVHSSEQEESVDPPSDFLSISQGRII